MSGLSEGFSYPSIASTSQESQAGVEKRMLRVTPLSREWRSSTNGDVSTINRELAIQLAKHPNVQVSVFVPQCIGEDKRIAANHNVQLIEADNDTVVNPFDRLINIPENHVMDCIIGHGVHLGRQIPLIKRYHHCKWVQVVHTAPEELGLYKSISEGEKMQQAEIELCEKADQVVAVGPKLADTYKRYLRSVKKDQDVLDLTPSIFTEFLDVQQATEERETFCVLVTGSGESEDFYLKGYDLAAQAIAALKDKSYQLRFICAPTGKGDETAEKLLQHGITRNQLILRRFNESREVLARLFCEVDLAIMPSRTEGFGLIALEALSAGLPVLVSGNSGLGKALKKVPTGSNCTVDSEDPRDWAKAIRAVCDKDRDVRLAETKLLREKYLEKYSWKEPCGFLMEKLQDLVFGSPGLLPSSVEYSQLPCNLTSQTHEGTNHTESFPGCLPLSVEHSQWPSTVTSQMSEGPSYQRNHLQSLGRPPSSSSVQYNQPLVPLTTVTQSPSQIYQTSHIQISSSHGWPPSVQYMYNELPFTSVTQSPTPVYQTSHTQRSSGYGNLPSTAEYSQLHFPVASPVTDRPSCQRGHAQSRGLAVVNRILKAEYNRRSWLKPLLWKNTIQLSIEDVYTRLKIVPRRKRDFQLENNEVNMYDIFKDKDDVIALVEGSPGIGKTTFCLKIANDWAKERIPEGYSFPEFEVVLLLKCRDIEGDVMEAIDEQLLPERMEETVKKEFMDYLKDFSTQEKVLIVLDGLDELPKDAESHVNKLLDRKILPFSFILVTSRQEKGIVVRQKVFFDILLQIEGFTKEDGCDYIRKYFRTAGPEHLPRGERLINEIEENNFLDALLKNPLNLLLLCVVFEDYQGELPSVRTELYQIIVCCILRRYCKKHSLEAPVDDKALEKKFEDSLLALGELAWSCLLEDRHSFCEEKLARYERYNKDLAARTLGLVFKEASMKRINPQHEYHFFHDSFQEYLAASYLAHKILKEQLNVFRDDNLSFYGDIVKQYGQVFLFVSVILGEDATVLFGQIGEALKSKDRGWLKCSYEEATFFTESLSEIKSAEEVAMTLCSYIPFPSSVEINAGKYGDERDSVHILTVANACKNFSRLQHPLHLTITKINLDDYEVNVVVDFIASWSQITTLSFSIGFLSNAPLTASLFAALSENLTLLQLIEKVLHSIIADDFVQGVDFVLAASKTSRTLKFKLLGEENDGLAITLASGLSSDTPLPSVVFKIYDSVSDAAVQALQNFLSNSFLTSLDLIGDMTDPQTTLVGKGLAEETMKSLTLIIYGKVSCSAAISLKKCFLENTFLNSLKVKVLGELPDNWVAVENALMAKKSTKSVAVYPYVRGNITDAEVACLCPFFEENSLNVRLHSLTLNLWGKLSCNGAEALLKLLTESSTFRVTLNIHGTVTDAVADRFLRYLKPFRTMSFLTINIWGELTRNGNSALRELSCNKTHSFEFNLRGVTSDDRICNSLNSTVDFSSSSTSVLETIKDTSKSKLSFNITNHWDMSGGWRHGLGESLSKYTSLRTLSLTFNSCSDMSGDWGHGLGDDLAKNTSFTTLGLTFNSCSDMSGDWGHGLGDGLAKNTSLTTLGLTFNSCSDMSGDWGHGLVGGLAKNTSFTTLGFTFNSCSDMSGDWGHGLGDGLAKSTSLATLGLTFSSWSVLSGGWGHGLGDGLAKNTSLTTLSLAFNSYSDISGGWGRGLGDGLAKNTSLTTLSLTFDSWSDVSGDWGHGLGDGLAKNTSLSTLSLTFSSYSDTSGDWAHGLGDGLAKNTSLTTLSLTVNSYSDVIGNCGRDLGDGLARNASLTTLSIAFNSYSDISEDWGRDLGDGLAKNTSLTTLSLTVNSYSVISENWGRGLGDGLAKNTSLTTLSLTFSNYSGTSEDWLKSLCGSLAKSDTKATLNLTISGQSVTGELLNCDLSKHLADCKSLSSLNLTVSLYGETSAC